MGDVLDSKAPVKAPAFPKDTVALLGTKGADPLVALGALGEVDARSEGGKMGAAVEATVEAPGDGAGGGVTAASLLGVLLDVLRCVAVASS